MATTEEARLRLVLEMKDRMSKEMRKSEKSIDKLDKKLRGMRTQMVAVSGASAAMLGGSAREFISFEKGMREVQTLLDINESQFKDMSDQVQDMAHRMGINAVEATKSLYQAISSGIPKENVMTFMETAAKLSIGGVTDLETATLGLKTALNAYGVDASRSEDISDTLFETMRLGTTTIGELSAFLFQAVPTAAAFGVSLEEVAAATALVTRQGSPTSFVMRGLRAAMVALVKPTEDMQQLIEKMGFATGGAALKALGLQGTLEALLQAAGGSKDALTAAGLQAESLAVVFGITGEKAEQFQEFLVDISDGAGATEAAFSKMEKSTARDLEHLKADVQNLAISIGEDLMPSLDVLVSGLRGLTNRFSELDDTTKAVTTSVVALTGALAGLGLAIQLGVIPAVKGLKAAWLLLLKVPGFSAIFFSTFAAAATASLATVAAGMVPVILGGKQLERSQDHWIEQHKKLNLIPQNYDKILDALIAVEAAGDDWSKGTSAGIQKVARAIGLCFKDYQDLAGFIVPFTDTYIQHIDNMANASTQFTDQTVLQLAQIETAYAGMERTVYGIERKLAETAEDRAEEERIRRQENMDLIIAYNNKQLQIDELKTRMEELRSKQRIIIAEKESKRKMEIQAQQAALEQLAHEKRFAEFRTYAAKFGIAAEGESLDQAMRRAAKDFKYGESAAAAFNRFAREQVRAGTAGVSAFTGMNAISQRTKFERMRAEEVKRRMEVAQFLGEDAFGGNASSIENLMREVDQAQRNPFAGLQGSPEALAAFTAAFAKRSANAPFRMPGLFATGMENPTGKGGVGVRGATTSPGGSIFFNSEGFLNTAEYIAEVALEAVGQESAASGFQMFADIQAFNPAGE